MPAMYPGLLGIMHLTSGSLQCCWSLGLGSGGVTSPATGGSELVESCARGAWLHPGKVQLVGLASLAALLAMSHASLRFMTREFFPASPLSLQPGGFFFGIP